MSKRKSLIGCPVLLTHWDPDLYPKQPLPLVPELVIYLLAHGEVWLKDVDLFLNPKIAAYLSNPSQFEQFSSLIATKRIKVLIPDGSRDLHDPINHPILSTAMEIVRSERPYKGRPWKMTDSHKKLCEKLDTLLVANGGLGQSGVVRQRVSPPSDKNEFAIRLVEVLNGQDTVWRRRQQFRGIDKRLAERFIEYALNHELALEFLRKRHVKPIATNGFYRTLLYQCADCLPAEHQRKIRSLKNLGQSVYAHCELDRQKAIGTYHGTRIAEIPPTDKTLPPGEPIFRVEVVPMRTPLTIPIATNIGEIVSDVLAECGDHMKHFWAIAGASSVPEVDFSIAWEHVAAAFANCSGKPRPLGKIATRVWEAVDYIVHGTEILDEARKKLGFSWASDFHETPSAHGDIWLAIKTVATFGRPAMEHIRRGRADTARKKTKEILLNAATARCGQVAP